MWVRIQSQPRTVGSHPQYRASSRRCAHGSRSSSVSVASTIHTRSTSGWSRSHCHCEIHRCVYAVRGASTGTDSTPDGQASPMSCSSTMSAPCARTEFTSGASIDPSRGIFFPRCTSTPEVR